MDEVYIDGLAEEPLECGVLDPDLGSTLVRRWGSRTSSNPPTWAAASTP